MKRLLLITILVTSIYNAGFSQGVTLTPTIGYNFDESFNVSGGSGHISDNETYGGILGFDLKQNMAVELSYVRQEAIGKLSYYFGGLQISDNHIPVSLSYLQIGGVKKHPFSPSGKVEGYGGLMLGAFIVNPKDDYDDVWRFAVGFKLGVNIWMTPKVGLKLQTNLQMPIQDWGGSIYIGTGGSGAGVSATSTITQFGFTGGISFRFAE